MQKVSYSPCGEHVYADPVPARLLFVLRQPPNDAMLRRLNTIALFNGFNGHAVTWLFSSTVSLSSTQTHRDKLLLSVSRAKRVVAAWGAVKVVPDLGDVELWCMGRTTHLHPICPALGTSFRRYNRA